MTNLDEGRYFIIIVQAAILIAGLLLIVLSMLISLATLP